MKLVQVVKNLGVDVVDCSSAGNSPLQKIILGPGYQVPFADAVKKQAQILTAAVGLIEEPKQCEEILQNNSADLVFIARAHLRNTFFAQAAALEFGLDIEVPLQYDRGKKVFKK